MESELNQGINRNYNWLFIKPEQRAIHIQNMIKEIIATSNNDEQRVKKALKEYVGDGVEFYDDSYLLDLISFIYSKENEDIKEEILEFIKTFPFVSDIKRANQFIQIETDKGIVECASISDMIRTSGKADGDDTQSKALEMFARSIESVSNRQSNCHDFSMTASELFQYEFNTPNNIVTGYAKYYVPENKYLHSWMEIKRDGKDYVLDFTKNTIIDKESYYRLLHIDEQEICSVISSEEITADKRHFGGLIKLLDSKTYLTSRHEIIRDLNRNKHLFDNSDIDSGEER